MLLAEGARINAGTAMALHAAQRLVNDASPFTLHLENDEAGALNQQVRDLLSLDVQGRRQLAQQLHQNRLSLQAARKRLDAGDRGAARQAIALLTEEYQRMRYSRERYGETVQYVERFLEEEAAAKLQRDRSLLWSTDILRQQVIGSAMSNMPMDPIAKYEAHLDRKFERTLAMLLKLKAVRAPQKNLTENQENKGVSLDEQQ